MHSTIICNGAISTMINADGIHTAIFSNNPQTNKANIAMLYQLITDQTNPQTIQAYNISHQPLKRGLFFLNYYLLIALSVQ
ncbi:MAG: hypothetical protein QM768_01675 [Agriterribacter sp.]